MLCSVFAAFFGVQSRRNYLRDFASDSAWLYIIFGLFGAGLFIFIVYLLVLLALSYA
ncbi:DUF2970 domain-containing protein [uncultured Neptuniibacter sp.]|uniref:DUF2970 domain-containing protein n=1 Tax=uncultured Neptuniibacter sp. TaxID=502143 RepID=UPI00345595FF